MGSDKDTFLSLESTVHVLYICSLIHGLGRLVSLQSLCSVRGTAGGLANHFTPTASVGARLLERRDQVADPEGGGCGGAARCSAVGLASERTRGAGIWVGGGHEQWMKRCINYNCCVSSGFGIGSGRLPDTEADRVSNDLTWGKCLTREVSAKKGPGCSGQSTKK